MDAYKILGKSAYAAGAVGALIGSFYVADLFTKPYDSIVMVLSGTVLGSALSAIPTVENFWNDHVRQPIVDASLYGSDTPRRLRPSSECVVDLLD